MTALVSERMIRNGDVELYARLRIADRADPTMILLCGLGFHTFEYEPLTTELAGRGVNTMSFDYRGHGRSSGARGRWILDDLAADAAAAIADARTQGLERIHLVGNSLGGMIAVVAGARDQDIVSVVASNTPAHAAEFMLTRPRRALYHLARSVSKLVPLRISVNHFYSYERLTDDTTLIDRIRRDTTIRSARRLTLPTYHELLDTWNGPAAIARLHHPMLLIHGTSDQLQPAEQSSQLYAAANEPKQHHSISAGHLPHLDATTELADLLTTWLQIVDSD